MSEQAPESRSNIHFNIGGEIFDATPSNTLGFIHTNEADEQFDHVFVLNSDENEAQEGYFIFRQSVENFDDVIEHMSEGGFTIIAYDESQLNDRLAYFNLFPPKYDPKELTQRQNNRVAFLGHLLANELLAIEDFAAPGELYI